MLTLHPYQECSQCIYCISGILTVHVYQELLQCIHIKKVSSAGILGILTVYLNKEFEQCKGYDQYIPIVLIPAPRPDPDRCHVHIDTWITIPNQTGTRIIFNVYEDYHDQLFRFFIPKLKKNSSCLRYSVIGPGLFTVSTIFCRMTEFEPELRQL